MENWLLGVRIKDDTPEMLKSLGNEDHKGGWLPTSTIDPHEIREGLENRFVRIRDDLKFLSGAANIALRVLYVLRIDRYMTSSFLLFVLQKQNSGPLVI